MRKRGTFDGLGVLRDRGRGWRDGFAAATRAGSSKTRLQAAQALDCADWLPNDLLTKLDRCLMAHGLEGRVPFLDPVVAAFAFPLPDRLKVRNRLGKWLLRRWLDKLLPASGAYSAKRGFTVPVGEWIATRPELGRLVAEQPAIAEICRPGAVEALFSGAQGGRRSHAAWTLLFYALWHKRHIEGAPVAGDVFETLRGG